MEGHRCEDHDEQLEYSGQEERRVPTRRGLHVHPHVQREASARAECGSSGNAQGKCEVLLVKPHEHRGRAHGNEHRSSDATDDSEKCKLGVVVGQPGHDACESLDQQAEHEHSLHADSGCQHATWNV